MVSKKAEMTNCDEVVNKMWASIIRKRSVILEN